MSIASEITRLQGCKANIRTALVNKGITSASTHNMADFATDISNISAGGATITVTYNSSFYNKTMTCTKGSTTYTQTTTSSGSTSFNVTDEGTWTITCNGVTRTVYVTLNYSTQMAITKTITINGAQEDYITFTDVTGSKVCQFASGQTSASVSITYIPNQSITFTSSVAKNPNNLSQNYSKSITLTDSTSSINVRPDTALYWYGYNNGTVVGMGTGGFSQGSYTMNNGTWNTNNIVLYTASDTWFSGITLNNGNKLPAGSVYNIIASNIKVGIAMSAVSGKTNFTSKYVRDGSGGGVIDGLSTLSMVSENYAFIGTGTVGGRGGTIHAIYQ